MFGQGELESYGIEDCRVTQIGETYYLTFTQVSEHGVGVGLRSTTDWRKIRQHGMILPPHNKDCAIFGEQIGGKYYALHRPSSPVTRRQLHLARRIARPRALGPAPLPRAQSAGHVGQRRVSAPGPLPSARRTAGWKSTTAPMATTAIVSGRCCWISNRPGKSSPARASRSWNPIADYERTGFFGNVVFTNGHVVDGDTVTLYYGASDSVICGARFSIRGDSRNPPLSALHEQSSCTNTGTSSPIRATCGSCCSRT